MCICSCVVYMRASQQYIICRLNRFMTNYFWLLIIGLVSVNTSFEITNTHALQGNWLPNHMQIMPYMYILQQPCHISFLFLNFNRGHNNTVRFECDVASVFINHNYNYNYSSNNAYVCHSGSHTPQTPR